MAKFVLSKTGYKSKWTRKSSTACEANKILQDRIINQNISIPVLGSEKNCAINRAKKEVNKSIKEDTLVTWNDKV